MLEPRTQSGLDETPGAVTQLTILVDFFDEVRRAQTIGDINLAAGIARQELLDLAEDAFDHLRDLFEVDERLN